jgi:hypothetical protein
MDISNTVEAMRGWLYAMIDSNGLSLDDMHLAYGAACNDDGVVARVAMVRELRAGTRPDYIMDAIRLLTDNGYTVEGSFGASIGLKDALDMTNAYIMLRSVDRLNP